MCIRVYEYITLSGKSPYDEWLNNLRDEYLQSKIASHIDRLEFGIFGDSQPVGGGISELRIHYGPGYRIYYAKTGKKTYLLLCGGDKSSQKKDIKIAKHYLSIHKKTEGIFS